VSSCNVKGFNDYRPETTYESMSVAVMIIGRYLSMRAPYVKDETYVTAPVNCTQPYPKTNFRSCN